jgi:hypothetical protein
MPKHSTNFLTCPLELFIFIADLNKRVAQPSITLPQNSPTEGKVGSKA